MPTDVPRAARHDDSQDPQDRGIPRRQHRRVSGEGPDPTPTSQPTNQITNQLTMFVYLFVCMPACMYACMHACLHLCMYVCMAAGLRQEGRDSSHATGLRDCLRLLPTRERLQRQRGGVVDLQARRRASAHVVNSQRGDVGRMWGRAATRGTRPRRPYSMRGLCCIRSVWSLRDDAEAGATHAAPSWRRTLPLWVVAYGIESKKNALSSR